MEKKAIFLKVRGLQEMHRGRKHDLAYVICSDYQYEQLVKDGAKRLRSPSPYIAIINEEVVVLDSELMITQYMIVSAERNESLMETLNEHNLTINEKGQVCFLDYSQIDFKVDGNILTYNDFCRYELPEGQVFKFVHDNGYSYIGSSPFRGTAKEFADGAIALAKKKGYVWFWWMCGRRFDEDFCIDVSYGRDESYSCVSNS